MGCTDEKSVSNKSQKKRNRNFSSTDNNPKNDKKGSINNQDKLNQNEDDVKKYDQKDKEIKQIQFNNDEENSNNSRSSKDDNKSESS